MNPHPPSLCCMLHQGWLGNLHIQNRKAKGKEYSRTHSQNAKGPTEAQCCEMTKFPPYRINLRTSNKIWRIILFKGCQSGKTGPESQGHRWGTSYIWMTAGSIPNNNNNKTNKKQNRNRCKKNKKPRKIYIVQKPEDILGKNLLAKELWKDSPCRSTRRLNIAPISRKLSLC